MLEKLIMSAIKVVTAGIVFMLMFGMPASAQESGEGAAAPPALEKGWNLISVPCTVNAGGLNKAVLRQLSYYTWDGEKYVRTTMLERGRGYIVDAAQVVNPSSICEAEWKADPAEIELKEGWNLVGNPYHKDVPVTDVLGDAAVTVFEYRGNRFVELEEGDKLKPWRGYWVYADRDSWMILPKSCRLDIHAYGADRILRDELDVYVGQSISLLAGCVYGAGDKEFSINITDQVEWRLSDKKTGNIEEARFIARNSGETGITAVYEKYVSDPVNVTVKETMAGECGEIQLGMPEAEYTGLPDTRGYYYYETGSTGTERTGEMCSMCGGEVSCAAPLESRRRVYWRQLGDTFGLKAYCVRRTGESQDGLEIKKDITGEVDWYVNDENIVKPLDGSEFIAVHEGETGIYVVYHDLVSATAEMAVRDLRFESLKIEPGESWTECGESAECGGARYMTGISEVWHPIEVTGYFRQKTGDSEFLKCSGEFPPETVALEIDMSLSAAFTVSDNEVIGFSSGPQIREMKEGTAFITATALGVKSEAVGLRVLEVFPEMCVELDVVTMPFNAGLTGDEDFAGYYEYTGGSFDELPVAARQCTGCFADSYSCREFDGMNKLGLKWYETGAKFKTSAICRIGSGDGQAVDVSAYVKWEIGDERILADEGKNIFRGKAPGRTALTAVYSSRRSTPHLVEVGGLKAGMLEIFPVPDFTPCSEKEDEKICDDEDYLIADGGSISFDFTDIYVPESETSALMTCEGELYAGEGFARRAFTGDIKWYSSDRALSSMGNGLFMGETDGTSVVTATLGKVRSKDVKVKVVDPERPLRLFLDRREPVVLGYQQKLQIKAYLQYYEKVEDVTEDAVFKVMCEGMTISGEAVSIENGEITGGPVPCKGYLEARYERLSSETLSLDTLGLSGFDRITIDPPIHFWLSGGGSYSMKANGYYGNDRVEITQYVNWDIESDGPETPASIVNGRIKAGTESGSGKVFATLGNLKSSGLQFEVMAGAELIATPSSLKMVPGARAPVRATAKKFGSQYCYPDATTGGAACWFRTTDITDAVEWKVSTASGGTPGRVEDGWFIATEEEWSGFLQAEYEGMKSNRININVEVLYPRWMTLEVFADTAMLLPECPIPRHCFYAVAGEKTTLKAMVQKSGNYWTEKEDVTHLALWEVSDESVATVHDGVINPIKAGMVWVRVYVGDARSEKAWLVVIDKTKQEYLLKGLDAAWYKAVKPLKTGEHHDFFARLYGVSDSLSDCTTFLNDPDRDHTLLSNGMYLCYSDVTSVADWISPDPSIASFADGAGRVTGNSPGFVDVFAEYAGLKSNTTTIDVWDDSDMRFCDENKNYGEWNDEYSKATLETSCRHYSVDENVYIRYSAYIFNDLYLDNCLDLYILDADNNIVKTLREQGCTTEPLNRSTTRVKYKVYGTVGEWDQTDDAGNKVAPGRYYAVARFYIIWEPVIRLPIDIIGGDQVKE